MNTSTIVQKFCCYCNVLRDDGMSYRDYPSTLVKKDGDELFDHYRHTLEELGKQKGLLGLILTKSQGGIPL
jgi:type I restriction enzyme M protein